jgi:predicted flap endonuclease-1-like 5' DNA nuclease/predicted  nucleic acid-binding Zn-ribbon protein
LEPIWIAAAGGLAAVLSVWVAGAVRRHRGAPRAGAAADETETRAPADERGQRPEVSAGEREAAWSAGVGGRLLASALAATEAIRLRLVEAESLVAALDRERDDLRQAVADADAEVTRVRSQLDDAESRIAALETEIAAGERSEPAGRLDELEKEIAAMRDAVARHAAAERDIRHRLQVAQSAASAPTGDGPQSELDAALMRIEELQGALASTDDRAERALREQAAELAARLQSAQLEESRLSREVDSAHSEAARARAALEEARDEADRRIAAAAAEVARHTAKLAEMERAVRESDRDAGRLIVRDAEIADLEARLAALSAARDSELRRLNDKIGSMERLYVEVEARERRIESLEGEVKALAEARDDAVADLARSERELVALQGAHAEAIASLDRMAELEASLREARTRVAELERHDESGALRAEIDRLRVTLASERERTARMQRRLSLDVAEERPGSAAPTYAEWDRRLRERIDAAVEEFTAPLRTRIERLRSVVEEKERRIATLAAAEVPTGPDDLTRIRGIGPKIQEILHGLGIASFREIAELSDHDIARVGAALPVYGRRIHDDRWIEQARELTV